jgi:hypothetical protein
MGRKGVSKRKPSQSKSNPIASANVSGRTASHVRPAETLPVQLIENGKAASPGRGGSQPTSGSKNNHKKR